MVERETRVECQDRFRKAARGAGIDEGPLDLEDVLVSKLEWAKLGESERQIDDAAGIIRVQGDNLDVGYIQQWVVDLGLEHQWRAACARAV